MASLTDSHFKSSLPPRKRAKTDEEKEQRRVERILRNRRAAHASREKKRKHVEYLEAYVLALESNMSVLESNVSKLTNSIPKDSIPHDLESTNDLSDLKAKIHSNLSCTSNESGLQTMDLSDSCNQQTLSSMSDETEENDLALKVSIDQMKVKIEETDDFQFSKDQPQSYFNYLSPVSINSSPNSPIDLTMKQEPASPEATSTMSEGFTLSPISGPEYMAQNPAAILSPEVSAN